MNTKKIYLNFTIPAKSDVFYDLTTPYILIIFLEIFPPLQRKTLYINISINCVYILFQKQTNVIKNLCLKNNSCDYMRRTNRSCNIVVDILLELLVRNERCFALSCTRRRIVKPHAYIYILWTLYAFSRGAYVGLTRYCVLMKFDFRDTDLSVEHGPRPRQRSYTGEIVSPWRQIMR